MLFFIFFISSHADNLLKIASGSKDGTYYAIVKDLQKFTPIKNISTLGSGDNLKQLNTNYSDIVISQLDILNFVNKNIGNNNLKVLYNLYDETIHLFVKNNIKNIYDLNNKYIYCGDLDSGSCFTTHFIEKSYNLKFHYIKDLKIKKPDAIVEVIFAPANKLKNGIKGYKLFTLPDNHNMNNLYKKTLIPKQDYTFLRKDIKTYKVASAFIFKTKKTKKIDSFLLSICNHKNELLKNGTYAWHKVNFSNCKNLKGFKQ